HASATLKDSINDWLVRAELDNPPSKWTLGQIRFELLTSCNLGVKTCETLGLIINLENCLKELDLRNNDLQDSGVELLSSGLKSSHCKLQILRLSGCMITKKGCSSLASALILNPSHLKELDLTYNYPGESGVKLLSARLEDPHYGCDFTLDPNTAHPRLSLSEENRRVEWGEEQQSKSSNLLIFYIFKCLNGLILETQRFIFE
uniref:SPRY-associated domain-containing protein n=1 Tax=Astyanax mexicanus TaxID=7994 RepID=A0A8B9J729_ASTMX